MAVGESAGPGSRPSAVGARQDGRLERWPLAARRIVDASLAIGKQIRGRGSSESGRVTLTANAPGLHRNYLALGYAGRLVDLSEDDGLVVEPGAVAAFDERGGGMIRSRSAPQAIRSRLFRAVHGRNLVYNTCWEDPALDRVALRFQPDDRVLVITSAGCNALDYLLAGAGEVNAIDVNPIQNALLELKAAAIRELDHADFFDLFGRGRSPRARELYRDALRVHLSPAARRYWDRKIGYFSGRGWLGSFYYRGTSGLLAKLVVGNARIMHRLRGPIEDLLAARTIDQQREIYERRVSRHLWTPWLKWFLSRSFTLSLAGVPWPQRDQIARQYPGGVSRFIRDAFEAVLTRLSFADNYFWRVYLVGRYTPDCCPEYLNIESFERLRAALPGLKIHQGTVTEFLRRAEPGLSKFVLLDHMDWMSFEDPEGLTAEWEAILESARPGARAIFRSAGLRVDYLDHLEVHFRGRRRALGPLLRYHPELAAELHQRDRVHTYGSFSIADLPA